jgi:hypothetical protein
MPVKRADIQLEEPSIASGALKTMCRGWVETKPIPIAVLKFRKGYGTTERPKLLNVSQHSHVVQFMGYCMEGESELLLMEYAMFGSLSDAFTARRPDHHAACSVVRICCIR